MRGDKTLLLRLRSICDNTTTPCQLPDFQLLLKRYCHHCCPLRRCHHGNFLVNRAVPWLFCGSNSETVSHCSAAITTSKERGRENHRPSSDATGAVQRNSEFWVGHILLLILYQKKMKFQASRISPLILLMLHEMHGLKHLPITTHHHL